MTFWDTPEWHAYEEAYGDTPGTRARLLTSAEWRTVVVDLTLPLPELKRNLRKSYRSLVNKAGAPEAGDARDLFAGYRALHAEQAGRQTRPDRTWEIMRDWLATGHGMLVAAGREHLDAFGYFILWRDWAYYASGASTQPNRQHAVIWAAMRELQARGVRWLELGWVGQATDDKGKAVEFFKTGFGGHLIPANERNA